MKAATNRSWDLNQLLSDNVRELELPYSSILVHSHFIEDYAFTNEEISNECSRIRKVGLTDRIVVAHDSNGYSLIGPLLPYLALQSMEFDRIPCLVRSGDLAQAQQILSIELNASHANLSPLVMSRLIVRLNRLFAVIKSVSGMNPGIKREWIASILGISSSAVLRYSYISKVPAAIQLRCNRSDFPYLCLKDTMQFSSSQYNRLLDEIIHYELHSRYRTISASELYEIIHDISESDIQTTDDDSRNDHDTRIADTPLSNIDSSDSRVRTTQHNSIFTQDMPYLFDGLTTQYYENLLDSFADQYDEDIQSPSNHAMLEAARKNAYFIPDQTMRELAYQLYCLSQMRLTSGQRLLDYASLRSMYESLMNIYNMLT